MQIRTRRPIDRLGIVVIDCAPAVELGRPGWWVGSCSPRTRARRVSHPTVSARHSPSGLDGPASATQARAPRGGGVSWTERQRGFEGWYGRQGHAGAAHASAPPWASAWSAGRPSRSTVAETTRPLRFLGDPHASMPRSPTPARSPRPALLWRVDAAFRRINNVGSRACNLSRLDHAACTLPVYASQGGSLRHHATLGSGWWPALAGRHCSPAGSRWKVSECVNHISSLVPRLCLTY